MKRATRPSVGKLLRVVVAGGVALAGTAGPLAARAEEAPAKSDKAATEKAAGTGTPADVATAKKKAPGAEKEKPNAPEKKADEEAGGVKGW